MKILLATDGSECSEAAVQEVAGRPWPSGTEVRVISVFEPVFIPTPETWMLPPKYYDDIEKAGQERANKSLDHALSMLSINRELKTTGEVLRGIAKQAILDEAERWGANLIVLGSHGYRGWDRFLLGSVSQSVASHAKCSVEIVRCRAHYR
jgi:nucleotide-binding universal stress UspA family protein